MSALDTQVGGDHYKKLKIQPVEYMHANGIPFIEGCIIKYASRWRDKGGIADLEKIKHFAQLLIDLETAEAASEQCGQKEFDPTTMPIIELKAGPELPDWSKAPSWAKFTAQDECGDWCWFDVLPVSFDEENEWMLGDDWTECETALESDIRNEHWRDTLQSRPQ